MSTGWPFLVARGRTRDYRTVLVPEPLAGRGLQSLLADALAIPDPAAGVRTITLRPRDMEPLTITARAEVATADTVGGDPRDEHGRPLEFVYGVVQMHPTAAPDQSDLSMAREQALASYRRFVADEERFTFDTAAPLSGADAAVRTEDPMRELRAMQRPTVRLPQPGRPQPGRPQPGRPQTSRPPTSRPQPGRPPSRPVPQRDRRSSRTVRLVAVAAALVIAAVVLVVAWALRSSPAPPKTLSPVTAMELTVCTDQGTSRLVGTITLDAPAEVILVVRDGGTALPAQQLAAGEQAVNIPLPARRDGPFEVSAEVKGGETATVTASPGC